MIDYRLFAVDEVARDGLDFDSLADNFRWDIPEYFNIAEAVCDRHVERQGEIALYYEHENGAVSQYTFGDVYTFSNQLANLLLATGISREDCVALILPQRIETAVTHIAAFKLAAISLPLSILFGEDALEFRLNNSEAKVVITDSGHAKLLCDMKERLPFLQKIYVCDKPVSEDPGIQLTVDSDQLDGIPLDNILGDFWHSIAPMSAQFTTAATRSNAPALLIYTSGTTGPPKGALIAHRSLIGNLTGFELSLNFYPAPGDIFYTPADWAWTGGLLDGLLPCWYYGQPIVGYEYRKFNAKAVLSLLEKYSVTCGFFPPTALKMLRAEADIASRYDLTLRSVMSAGEIVGEELLHWARNNLNITINEMYGQTEHNYMVGNCSAIMSPKPGSMGKPYPGHRVAVMDEQGALLPDHEIGEFVAHKEDAVHFLGYWKNPDATAAKFTDQWFHTGDTGYRDEDGYLWFVGRTDDVISSSGYRIGPGEIEDCILKHESVLQAAAIGAPDPEGVRGDIVKVFIVLKTGFNPSEELAEQIRVNVRDKLAAYEYPRAIEFVTSLPMTTTGKVRRLELRDQELRASMTTNP